MRWYVIIKHLSVTLRQEQRRCVDGTLQREVKKVRKARNRRQEWNMMAFDKELRPDHRHSHTVHRGGSTEGPMSPEHRYHSLHALKYTHINSVSSNSFIIHAGLTEIMVISPWPITLAMRTLTQGLRSVWRPCQLIATWTWSRITGAGLWLTVLAHWVVHTRLRPLHLHQTLLMVLWPSHRLTTGLSVLFRLID